MEVWINYSRRHNDRKFIIKELNIANVREY